MNNKENKFGQIIGQIALMQNVIVQLPDKDSIMEFVCKGFQDIPGVEDVTYSLSTATEQIKNNQLYIHKISHKSKSLGSIYIKFSNKELLNPYLPYIENFCTVLAIVFEEQYQRKRNDQLLHNLEKKVNERTSELQKEIEQRKITELNLKYSKEKLSFALIASKSGIWDWDLIENKVFFGENYYKISGYEINDFPAEYIEWEKRVHPEDLDATKKKISDYLDGKINEYNVEFRFLCKDNKWMWILGQGKIFEYKNGVPARFIGTHTDINKRKIAEDNLINAKQYISNIINSMPSALIGIDKNSKINQCNLHTTKNYGVTSKELLGKNLFLSIPTLKSEQENIHKAIETKEVVFSIKESNSQNNNQKVEEITIFPLLQNGTDGAVIRIDDVTKQYELQKQLQQNQKMDAIGQLAGGVAHDFNNMLAGIIGCTDILRNILKNNTNAMKFINMIEKSANHAADLASKLLTFARNSPKDIKPRDIHYIIEEAVSILRNTIDKRINILTNLKSDNPISNVDSSLMQSVFLNLGINSSHSIQNEGEIIINTSDIILSKEYCDMSIFKIKPGSYIDIEVVDTGKGISKENLHKIFEPFFTTKEIGKGTGLGLAAVYGTIQLHQGAITVSSEIDNGTSFHIYLPQIVNEISDHRNLEEKIIKGIGHILLVDDEEAIRITGSELLKACGYTIETANNGKEAIEKFKLNDFDLVILDMIMPVMNGSDCLIELNKINSKIPVVISSGFSKNRDIDKLNKIGYSAFIKKPFRIIELSKIVSELLS